MSAPRTRSKEGSVPADAPLGSSKGAAVGSHRARHAPVLKLRTRVMLGDAIAVGPGKVALLEAIGQTGSITAAAKRLGMSYRRAWMLLDELNRSLKQPAAVSAKGGEHGGGSEVTPTGQELIALYRRIEAQAATACRADIEQLLGLVAN